MQPYPITALIGRRGSGKTLFMTKLAEEYASDGFTIYANYHLTKTPYRPLSFKQLAELPDYLYDAVVLLDEIQIGADSYEIFKPSTKQITKFATQLRKRRITLFYATQDFKMAAKRLRGQTDYIIKFERTSIDGVANLQVFDMGLPILDQCIKTFIFDGRPYFDHYDTDEIITFENFVTENT
jgi:hypothetical protein